MEYFSKISIDSAAPDESQRFSAIFKRFSAIFSDFRKITWFATPLQKKCQRFTEFCLTNLRGIRKKWDSVQTSVSLFFVFHTKKSSFLKRFSFSDFQRFWKSLKIAENRGSKFRNHDLSRKVIPVEYVYHSCQPAISLEACASRSNSGNLPMFWSDSQSGFGSPGPEGQLWLHYL